MPVVTAGVELPKRRRSGRRVERQSGYRAGARTGAELLDALGQPQICWVTARGPPCRRRRTTATSPRQLRINAYLETVSRRCLGLGPRRPRLRIRRMSFVPDNGHTPPSHLSLFQSWTEVDELK